jgi:flagellar basal-body rod protein FlgF
MDLGLSIAASGMLAEQVRQDQLSNDLANSSTSGFKQDNSVQQSFGSLLLSNVLTGQQVGAIQTGVRIAKTVTDMSQGPIQQTGQPLDFAITGTGFFAVRTPTGVEYTRNGQFSANAAGQLVDSDGDLVLSQAGAPIQVDAKGAAPATALGVFSVPNAAQQGNNLFTGTAAGRGTGTVQSGALEGSGVDPITTMVDMITSLRTYQSGQQAIQAIGQTLQECAQNVGTVQG